MGNTETQAMLDTRHRTKTNKRQKAAQKTLKTSTTDPIKIPGVNPGSHKG